MAFQFSDSIFLRTQKERIIPYVASITYFFWAWYVSKNQLQIRLALVFFLLGIVRVRLAALMANNYFKISMHALGVGGAVAFMVLLGLSTEFLLVWQYQLATLIAGLVCTARFIVSDHYPGDVYAGLFTGAFANLLPGLFVTDDSGKRY